MSLHICTKKFAVTGPQGARCMAMTAEQIRARAKARAPVETKFIPRESLKTTRHGQTTVATIETSMPVSRLAVFFRAGPRFETDKTQGVAHMLRICAGLGTSGASHFGLSRAVEAAGGNLSCTLGREHISYTVEATRDKISSVDRFLQDVAVNQVFKPWEIQDNVPRAKLERAIRSQETRLMELIHKAAFRKGLGYSLYSPKWMIGNHSSEMLSSFMKSNFGEAAVVGIGMPHEQASDFANRLNLSRMSDGEKKKGGKPTPSKFHVGSDLRKETTDRLAYVALAIEGPSWKDPKSAFAGALVHRALGSIPRIHGGISPGAKLTAALGDKDVKASVQGFSASYSDSGIMGATIAAPTKHVDNITRKVADILRSVKFGNEDCSRAKALLKGDLNLREEKEGKILEDLGYGCLFNEALSLAEQLAILDKCTADDMNKAMGERNFVMAAFGNVSNVPFLDSLK